MNKVILMGRMTKDITIKQYQSANGQQSSFGRFDLAVNRPNDKDTTDFFHCTAFGKNALNLERYTGKGAQLLVEGRIQFSDYMNQEGQRIHTTEVIVERFEFCGRKNDNAANSETPGGFVPVEETDLPFQ